MQDLIRKTPGPQDESSVEPLLTREWLVTNGLGGYASGTIGGVVTRRYHGLLIAALPVPLGRTMMLGEMDEELEFADGTRVDLSGEERPGLPPQVRRASYIREFLLEWGIPVWRYVVGGAEIERRVLMPYGQNTVHVQYRHVAGVPLTIRLRPAAHVRPHEAPVNAPLSTRHAFTGSERRYELCLPGSEFPALRMRLHGRDGSFIDDARVMEERLYRVEETRGYDARGYLWSPGHFRANLAPGDHAAFVASTESWEAVDALPPDEAYQKELGRRQRLVAMAATPARQGFGAELVLAADQFIIAPSGRVEDAARARAAGEDVRTIIAGYHWFTDWGRDTMISLEGLTLCTNRHAEARWIVNTFAHYAQHGLIPNMFPEGEEQGLYNTADATLWFFHALDRYLRFTGDRETIRALLPRLRQIVDAHLRGTRFNIHVDKNDGLLVQGEPGYQLTWMDAKMGDWVVTPRRGKAVEINALWYNALRLLQKWLEAEGEETAARRYAAKADHAFESFNRRFWYEAGGYLYDVVDSEDGTDDASCRPNQLFAISLEHAVLEPVKWECVLRVVQNRLVTPFGLRSLAPGHPAYKSRYCGTLRTRDGAYHQGTVWAWLIGPFVDAYLKVHPNDASGARRFLDAFDQALSEFGVGSIGEVFDGDEPFTPRGCIAQAWSVAEVLRCWVAVTGNHTRPNRG
jgi:predicted glycogen debranching enzyme